MASITRMLANTHKAICLDNRDLKKPKNEKIRIDIKFTIYYLSVVSCQLSVVINS